MLEEKTFPFISSPAINPSRPLIYTAFCVMVRVCSAHKFNIINLPLALLFAECNHHYSSNNIENIYNKSIMVIKHMSDSRVKALPQFQRRPRLTTFMPTHQHLRQGNQFGYQIKLMAAVFGKLAIITLNGRAECRGNDFPGNFELIDLI